MSRENWFFLLGLIVALLLISGYIAIKHSKFSAITPDRKVTYRIIDGYELTLHLFQAQGPALPNGYPVLLLFHGGAWKYGSPHQFYPQCQHFQERGLTCVSAQYRIASVHDSDPRVALEDAQAAILYLRQHAAELYINPKRIIAGGGSAGGHLAAALGVGLPIKDTPMDRKNLSRPNALVLYNPMLDLSPGRPDHHLVAVYWSDISPYHHIDGNIPPTLILLGTEDSEVPVSTAQAFCDKVIYNGGQCKLALYEGAKHGFFNHSVENSKYFNLTNQIINKFIDSLGFL
ncbi:MAG TPA: alpha/beta hydrolase [Syntrophomonadaceae bacterium]|nr:alpha/beta hydrolase [Gammaproteobacteria bacterium]HRX22427.1 alpha/beta hydrolase [Syntrophomonadaceae bacterium]